MRGAHKSVRVPALCSPAYWIEKLAFLTSLASHVRKPKYVCLN